MGNLRKIFRLFISLKLHHAVLSRDGIRAAEMKIPKVASSAASKCQRSAETTLRICSCPRSTDKSSHGVLPKTFRTKIPGCLPILQQGFLWMKDHAVPDCLLKAGSMLYI